MGCKILKRVIWPWPRPFQGRFFFGRVGSVMVSQCRGHSGLTAMSPFDREHTTSYSTLIELCVYLLPFSRYSRLFVESRRFWPTPPAFGALVGVTPVEFRWGLWQQKTRLLGVSCGVVCVILCLAVLVEHRLVTDRRTDRRTDTGPWLVPQMHSIAR